MFFFETPPLRRNGDNGHESLYDLLLCIIIRRNRVTYYNSQFSIKNVSFESFVSFVIELSVVMSLCYREWSYSLSEEQTGVDWNARGARPPAPSPLKLAGSARLHLLILRDFYYALLMQERGCLDDVYIPFPIVEEHGSWICLYRDIYKRGRSLSHGNLDRGEGLSEIYLVTHVVGGDKRLEPRGCRATG